MKNKETKLFGKVILGAITGGVLTMFINYAQYGFPVSGDSSVLIWILGSLSFGALVGGISTLIASMLID